MWDPIPRITPKRMSAMANTTPLVTTVTKPVTNPRDVDATPRVNIQEFCEEYYEDILPIIMDKVRRDRQKNVHTRLDFGERPRERIREVSHHSSVRARTTKPKQLKVQDRLRYDDRHVLDRLGHRRQSAFDRLSETYSPSTTKSRPRGTDSRDHPQGKSRPHKLDTSKEDRPKDRERFRSIGESYDDSFSHSYRDGNRSRHMKRRMDNESPLSSMSRSDSSDGRDPEDHVKIFQVAAQVERWAMPTWCHMFNSTLIGAARVWFDELPPESIDGYKDLKSAFLAYFMQQKKYVKDPVEIHNIKQKDRETIEDFIERFKVETGRIKGAPECMRIFGFMHGVNNLELTKRLNEHVPKTMEEMMITTIAFIRGEAAGASKKKGHASWKAQDQSKRQNSDKRSDFRGHQGKEGDLNGLLPLQGRRKRFWRPRRQRTTRQKVTQSFERVKEISFPPLAASSGTEGPLVIEAEIGGHMIHRMYVDGGSSMEILYEDCFNQLQPKIKSQMVPVTTSLTGFSGETIWPLGQLRLLVIIGDANRSTRAWMNFVIVRSLSPYNERMPSLNSIVRAFPSLGHDLAVSKEERSRPDNFRVALHPNFPDQEVAIRGMLSDKGRTELCSILKKNLDVFAWQPSDMTGVSRSIAKHQLNNREGYSPVRQKKRGQAPERAKAIQVEVQKLVEAGIMREVYYHDWLSNPVMDCYPLPEIDWKVESLCGYPFKCFLDAYKGYHQIQLAEPHEEKTTLHTGQGVCCYTKMPFGLKNAGASYQQLMDKAFESQIGRNIEAYVNDLVVKSYTEAKMMRDIEKTFRTLRKINMKLNPKKCAFGLAEGVFLEYVVTPDGIKLCPDKTADVLQLPSPRTIKEVQSLNGKLASLNRFLSKSAEKSFLKKCIKKSDFHWTAEAEQAFKQMKQHLSELPLLVAPKPKEELIIYLSATYGAISAVLMTESKVTQTPIYFISHALQGPELNYTPMEKLVLSLVFAAKRLRRYFQAHPITVITEQPIKQIMSRLDVAGRPQKWSIMLGEHNITYRPRTSGARHILTNLEGIEFTYALRFQFAASNNEAEYEALIAGLRIAARMGVKNVHVLVEVLKDKSIKEKEVATVVEEDRPTWMTPIVEYLKEGTLPSDKNEARKLRIKARHYELMEGILYRWSFLTPWLKCVGPLQAEYVGIDIAGPFSEGPGKVKFLIVVMDYFTKWIEAKVVATITGGQVKKFVWDNIVCRFGLPEIGMPTYRTAAVDVVSNDEELRLNLDLLEERRERATICEAKAKSKMKKYYNARVRGVTFRPGDFVYRSNDASHAVAGGKLGPKWEGPYEVTEALGYGAYKLRSMDGTILPRMWNIANLKRCYL
uniref:Reverse transcriptase domain-containing protein n=1 Tax=Tanacetum cinerariifolium TaxID=118510 RepID=A0A6L2K2X7_TANCI|nr:reverse transcriptase domain-containing protein [Tanacetum cinerariifolium]